MGRRSLRGIWSALASAVHYALLQHQTPRTAREGLPRHRWWRAPRCVLGGHDWVGPVDLVPWRLQHCDRCGEEIAHRTRWTDISPRETPLEPWGEAGWFDDAGPHDYEDAPASLTGLTAGEAR